MSLIEKRRGVVLVTSLGVMVVLTIMGSGLLLRSIHEDQISDRSYAQHRAMFLAEASVDSAIGQLRIGNTADLPTTALSGGSYWAMITDSSEDPALLASQYRIDGHGTIALAQRDLEAVTQMTWQSVFQFALFGEQTVDVSGDAITDSYNSTVGPYDPATSGQNGDVGTNSTLAGAVQISGTIAVNGQIVVGVGGDPNAVVEVNGGTALITGDPPLTNQSENLLLPPVSTEGLNCSNSLSLGASTTVTLPAGAPAGACDVSGKCCFADIAVSGGATLTLSQPLTVYVTNRLVSSGEATIGVVNDPTQLVMILTSSAQSTLQGDVTGSCHFYGGIYAPDGELHIDGEAEIFGSVIAEDIHLSGDAQIHYDEALLGVGPIGSSDVDVLEWRELD